MAWPPPVLPINFTNATPQLDHHPAAHAAVNQAVNDIVPKVQTIDAAVTGLKASAGRLIGLAERFTDAGPITGATPMAGLAVTLNLAEARTLNVTFQCRILIAGGADAGTVQIRENGAVIADGQWVANNYNYAQALYISRFLLFGAGVHTIEPWIVAGSTAVTVGAAAHSPITVAVVDYGIR